MPVLRVILLFPTTHAVMHAGQILSDADVANDIVPRPKGLDADCGIAVSVAPEDRSAAIAALREAGREPSRVMEFEKQDRPFRGDG